MGMRRGHLYSWLVLACCFMSPFENLGLSLLLMPYMLHHHTCTRDPDKPPVAQEALLFGDTVVTFFAKHFTVRPSRQ